MRPLLPVCLVLLVPALARPQEAPLLRVPLAEMEFADAKLGETVRRLHAAAEKMAGTKWQRKPFEELNPNVKGVYYAQWSSVGFGDSPHPWNQHGPGEVNYVTLGVFFHPSKEDAKSNFKILHTRLDARWKPPLTGWSAFVVYSTQPREWFECRWYYHQDPKVKFKHELDLQLQFNPYAQLQHVQSFGEGAECTLYSVSVRQKKKPEAMPIDDVWKTLATPEALRDYLLAVYTDQLSNIDDATRPDRGLIIHSAPYWSSILRNPSQPVASKRKLSDDEKTLIFGILKKRVRAQIAAVKVHYQDLHAAAERAFPLRQCLMEN